MGAISGCGESLCSTAFLFHKQAQNRHTNKKDYRSKEAYKLAFGHVREQRVAMEVIDKVSLHGR